MAESSTLYPPWTLLLVIAKYSSLRSLIGPMPNETASRSRSAGTPLGEVLERRVEAAGREHERRVVAEAHRQQQLAGQVELREALDADERVAQPSPDQQELLDGVVEADDVDQQLDDRRHAELLAAAAAREAGRAGSPW